MKHCQIGNGVGTYQTGSKSLSVIQQDFNVENCISELEKLTTPETRAEVLAGMKESMDKLGHGGAAAKAADAVLSLFN